MTEYNPRTEVLRAVTTLGAIIDEAAGGAITISDEANEAFRLARKHLQLLQHQPDFAGWISKPAISPEAEQATGVLVLTIDHRQGYEVSVHRSKESATNDLIAWVEQFWFQDGPKGDMPDDPDEAIKAYFDFADESYHISPVNITT